MRLAAALALLSGLSLAGPCLAAAKPPPAPAKLRPALPGKPAAAAQSKIAPLAGQLAAPPPFASAPGLASLGLATRGLGGTDAGPACRAACASARYTAGADEEGAAENWRRCVINCGSSRP